MITFLVVCASLALNTKLAPRPTPFVLELESGLALEPARHGRWFGGAVVAMVAALYIVFF